jgi:hypothetical protein
MLALSTEITNDQSIWRQLFHPRNFTLTDGVVKTLTSPGEGVFLIAPVVLTVLAASLAPALRGRAEQDISRHVIGWQLDPWSA